MNSARKNILDKIKESKLAHAEQVFSISADTEIYKTILPDAETCFKNELQNISGQCEIFDTENELVDFLKKILSEKKVKSVFCREKQISEKISEFQILSAEQDTNFSQIEVAISSCEFLIARTGSVVVTSASLSGRQVISYPPIHIVMADTSQLVNYPEDAYNAIALKYNHNIPSQITTITGPSRTADIEKTLVLGAHGPKEFIVLLCREKSFHNFAT